MNKQELIDFEQEIADLFKAGKIKCPVHLGGGSESDILNIFNKYISPGDFVFATHRNHFAYLLHTLDFVGLKRKILNGDSMHTCNPGYHFYSSSIVCGGVAIACGVALALKMKGSLQQVFIFLSDGACDEGWFMEAWRYAVGHNLPIIFVIENNNRSVCTSIKDRWGKWDYWMDEIKNFPKVIYYDYDPTWGHCGIGEFVNLEGEE